jgi:aldose 1-epimerase
MKMESHEKDGSSFITITNDVGLSLTLCDFGAGLYEVRYDDKPMTLAELDKDSWLHSDAYFGKTVGRIAGRLSGGKLPYLGNVYSLDTNEGRNTLHGGKGGFSYRPFKMDVLHLEEGLAVDFYYVSKAGEEGFPGEVNLRVRYFLSSDEPTYKIIYESKVSEQTPLNFTSHTYFNLGGEPTVEKQKLTLLSKENETYDPELIPLGFEASPSYLDFSLGKAIGEDINAPALQESRTKGYDHCFKFLPHGKKEPVIRLESEEYALEISTSLPCVQVYSYNYPHLGEAMSNGQKAQLHGALAIEPVYAPGDFHTMTVLPFEGRKDVIEYHFSKKEA